MKLDFITSFQYNVNVRMSSIYFDSDFKYYICISLTIPKGKQEAANLRMTGTDKTTAKKKKLKSTNNDLQITTQTTKDSATRTP